MKKQCPFTGDECYQHGCELYVNVQGTNPNTGLDVSEWRCTFAWLPMLMIEGSQQGRQTGAAVESFRNEMVKGNDKFMGMISTAQNKRLNGGDS